jgi:hypothetical protein
MLCLTRQNLPLQSSTVKLCETKLERALDPIATFARHLTKLAFANSLTATARSPWTTLHNHLVLHQRGIHSLTNP